jgi:hypothetical protein
MIRHSAAAVLGFRGRPEIVLDLLVLLSGDLSTWVATIKNFASVRFAL